MQTGLAPTESRVNRRIVHFAAFEFDLQTRELRKLGLKIKLSGQPANVLAMLIERAGEVITREELQQRLWSADTYVDFEHSLNAAIKRLRAALGDSADAPTFVETLARQGYRFIAEVQSGAKAEPDPKPSPPASIAVLPFANLGGDQKNEYFGDGLAEDVINELTKIPGLKVIARTSAFAFKNRLQDIRRIAELLGVSNVLEGSFRYEGNRVRVTAQLITAGDGSHLWSGRYDRDLSDVLTIQDEIAQAIAHALQAQLRGPGERRPTSSEAYQAYLEGRYYVQQVTPQGIERALECYQRAIRLDPEYALPHSGLALQAYYRVLYLAHRPSELAPAALASLGRALQLDAQSAQSHVVRGVFSAFYEYNWRAAEEHFATALEMDPASAMVRLGHALWFLLPTQRLDQALEEIRRAVALDPLSPAVRTAELWILYTMEQKEAADRARALIQLFPALPICRFAAGHALLRCGSIEEAANTVEEGLKIVPTDVFLRGVLALARAREGRVDDARQIRASLEERAQAGYIPFLSRAYAAEACGEMDAAYTLLDHAVDEREPLAVIALADRCADLQSYPAGQSLLRKMNLA
jgi:TolB-like protein